MKQTRHLEEWRILLTNTVRVTATTSTGIQRKWSWILGITREQNATAGAVISNAEKNIDPTSGPNINLPPQKNLWNPKDPLPLLIY